MKLIYLAFTCLLLFTSSDSVENLGEISNRKRQVSRGCEVCRVKNETVRVDVTKLCPRESVVITTRVCVGMCHSYEVCFYNEKVKLDLLLSYAVLFCSFKNSFFLVGNGWMTIFSTLVFNMFIDS